MTASVRIAAAQYPIGEPDSFASWQAKVGQWVGDAAAQGAQLLVFPEYAAMELAAIDKATASDLHASLRAVVALGPRIDAIMRISPGNLGSPCSAEPVPLAKTMGRL